MKTSIEFYQLPNGTIPMEEFLSSLDTKMKAKVIREINILQRQGNLLREPYSKYLRDGIFELRCKLGSNITRVFYFFYVGNTIVLTHGMIKKTKKTPQREIDRALRYKADYLERKDENHDI